MKKTLSKALLVVCFLLSLWPQVGLTAPEEQPQQSAPAVTQQLQAPAPAAETQTQQKPEQQPQHAVTQPQAQPQPQQPATAPQPPLPAASQPQHQTPVTAEPQKQPSVPAQPKSQTAAPAPSKQQPPAATQNLLPSTATTGAALSQQIQALVTGNEGELEPQETFGTRALGVVLTFINVVRSEGVDFITNFTAFPQFEAWLDKQITTPALLDRWIEIGQKLLFVVGGSLLIALAAGFLLGFARRGIASRKPKSTAARLGTLVSWLIVALLPVIVFIGTAAALMDQPDQAKIVRYIVMTAVYAIAVWNITLAVFRTLLAPRAEHLRLLPITTHQADYLMRWLGLFSFIMVFGYFGVDVARLVRVPPAVIKALSSLIGLIVVAMTVTIIVQRRSFVAAFLRNGLSAARHELTAWQSLRLWLARTWHLWAIAYLVIGYIVTMLGSGGGFAIMERGTILTVLVLVAMRLMYHTAERIAVKRHHGESEGMKSFSRSVVKGIVHLAIVLLGIAGIVAAWGADVEAMFLSPWGQRIMGSVFTIVVTVVIVVMIYEILYTYVEHRLYAKGKDGKEIETNGRARTLLPIIRNAAMIMGGAAVGLVTLSELGINIMPLLAGAGILGVAVGFGSQTLVKDFLTGLFIILEDNMAVGDTVTIDNHTGVVESIAIRTVRLRDQLGALHILPFSEITKIVNQSRDYSAAVITIGVAYDSDLRLVMKVMKDVGDDLKNDPQFRDLILEPIDVQGVENFGDSAITLAARIKTKPSKQLEVKRAYMLRLKERFDAENIEIPFPTVMQLQKT